MRWDSSWTRAVEGLIVVALCMTFVGAVFWTIENWSIAKSRISPRNLDTPSKRIFGVFFLAGTVATMFGIMQVSFESSSFHEFLNTLIQTVLFTNSWDYKRYWPLGYGLPISLIGLFGSYLYNSTARRIVDWIRYG